MVAVLEPRPAPSATPLPMSVQVSHQQQQNGSDAGATWRGELAQGWNTSWDVANLSLPLPLRPGAGQDFHPELADAYSSWITEDILHDIRANFYMHRQTSTAVLIALYTVTFFLGIVGNVLVIYIFLRNHKMRTVTNSFLVNLAFCDLMVVGLAMPFSVAVEVYANWVYGSAMCKIVNFSQGLSVTASILTLAVISAERFYAIRRPLRARAFMSRTRIQSIIFIIWLVSALANLPSVFVRRGKVVEKIFSITLTSCVEEWSTTTLKHAYNFALLFILYISPVIFICVGYLQIGYNLWRSNTALYASTSAAESQNARGNLYGRRRVAKMLFVMAVLFAISWLPYHIMGILLDFIHDEALSEKGLLLRRVYSFCLWLAHANSSINPICYCIMSSSFKSALRLELKRCCCQRMELARDSFMSLSMSMTVTTGAGGTSGRGFTTRVYRPVHNGRAGGHSSPPDSSSSSFPGRPSIAPYRLSRGSTICDV